MRRPSAAVSPKRAHPASAPAEKRIVGLRFAIAPIFEDDSLGLELAAKILAIPDTWSHVEAVTTIVQGRSPIRDEPQLRVGPSFDFMPPGEWN